MQSSRFVPSALVLSLAVACGGRIEGDGAPPSASVSRDGTEGLDFGGGEDPNAIAVAACAALGALEPETFPSTDAVASALTGRWLLCPTSLAMPDPLFGKASWVGVELGPGGVGRSILVEGGARLAVGPSSFAWSAESAPPGIGFAPGNGKVIRIRVEVGRDRTQVRMAREDLGGSVYTLVKV